MPEFLSKLFCFIGFNTQNLNILKNMGTLGNLGDPLIPPSILSIKSIKDNETWFDNRSLIFSPGIFLVFSLIPFIIKLTLSFIFVLSFLKTL